MNKAVLAFIAILVLPGCVTEDNVVDLDESQSDDGELHINFFQRMNVDPPKSGKPDDKQIV